jgi:hypothetical protein
MLLFAIEGPPLPWWVPPAGGAVGLFSTMIPGTATRVVGLGLLVPGAVWTGTRLSQYLYYRYIAEESPWSICIRCSYSLTGLDSDVCPECGCSQEEERVHAARIVSDEAAHYERMRRKR